MTLNHDVFFRKMTKTLFSNMRIEKALVDCIKCLKTAMPADLLILQYYQPDAGTHRVIATATVDEGKKWDKSLPFSPEAREKALDRVKEYEKTGNPVVLSNYPELDADFKIVLDFFERDDSSLLVMALGIGDRLVGSLAVFADGHDRYTEEHSRLFSLLREPFGIGVVTHYVSRENIKLTEMLKDDNRFLHQELQRLSGDHIVGEDFGLKNVMKLVRQVASLNSPVLLLGETGTGKDILAQAIHRLSARKDKPFITVNCGAIPDSLLDSELFGHEKGAFTGALSQKRGRFERADQGTIFLDEVGELPLPAQVRLLRVLQNKEIERVGGSGLIRVDIRVIAATNRNLDEMIKNGQFREDLWFRLNVFPIKIPPLRERKTDIPAFMEYFIERKAQELKLRPLPKVSENDLIRLEAYHWPGNIRELENIVERALIISKDGRIAFPELEAVPENRETVETMVLNDETPTFDEMVSRYFQQVLTATGGKIHGSGGAAELTDLNPSTLRAKLRKLGIRDS